MAFKALKLSNLSSTQTEKLMAEFCISFTFILIDDETRQNLADVFFIIKENQMEKVKLKLVSFNNKMVNRVKSFRNTSPR
jgi:hypothetical protein